MDSELFDLHMFNWKSIYTNKNTEQKIDIEKYKEMKSEIHNSF